MSVVHITLLTDVICRHKEFSCKVHTEAVLFLILYRHCADVRHLVPNRRDYSVVVVDVMSHQLCPSSEL